MFAVFSHGDDDARFVHGGGPCAVYRRGCDSHRAASYTAANVLPKLSSCVGEAMATKSAASARIHKVQRQFVSARTLMQSAVGHFRDESDADVDEDLDALLAEARATIIKIRGALA